MNKKTHSKMVWLWLAGALLVHVATLFLWLVANGLAAMLSDPCTGQPSFYCSWWGGAYFKVNAIILVASYAALGFYLYKSKVVWAKLLATALLPAANFLLLLLEAQIII